MPTKVVESHQGDAHETNRPLWKERGWLDTKKIPGVKLGQGSGGGVGAGVKLMSEWLYGGGVLRPFNTVKTFWWMHTLQNEPMGSKQRQPNPAVTQSLEQLLHNARPENMQTFWHSKMTEKLRHYRAPPLSMADPSSIGTHRLPVISKENS